MHKDKPPGIFDFAERSLGHMIGVCFGAGFILSIFVYVGFSLWRADSGKGGAPRDGDTLENSTARSRKAPSASPSDAAVRY
ncbi:MAG TPA: hypothetical protein VLO30_03575 [Chthoniobacterales bacterium]|nr:hypothetical protein [Chthoniobacterales bacterium]